MSLDDDIKGICLKCGAEHYLKFAFNLAGYMVGKCECGGEKYLVPNWCIVIVEEW